MEGLVPGTSTELRGKARSRFSDRKEFMYSDLQGWDPRPARNYDGKSCGFAFLV